MTMTGLERTTRILRRQPVDRIGVFEHFWIDTHRAWESAGHVPAGESFDDHFGFDMSECWAFNYIANLDVASEKVEETEDTVLWRDGNGALLRRHKKHDTTPEHVDFAVKTRADWDRLIKPHLLRVDRRRINFEAYRKAKASARAHDRFFFWSGINVFEQMHPICGHEHMLMGMLDDPEWIQDMVRTLAEVNLMHQQVLFAEEGLPDGIWYYEDMGFKERPFLSPAMYAEFIQPAHVRTIAFAKQELKLPVLMHSCGFVEPLLPGMLEAGIDCLQVIEIKAGMDLLRIHQTYGDRLSLMGGIDVRKLYTNDLAQIDAELLAKIPQVKKGFGYVLHSDHSIPATVDYAAYRHFLARGLELGRY